MSAPRVLLLHGIWMPGASMRWLGARLRAAGWATEVFAYPAARGGPERVLPALAERLRGAEAVLAHSLGGLFALEALRRAPGVPVRRVVCLGSPLCGSAAARALAGRRLTGWPLGRSAGLLCGGCRRWEGPAEVGVVAGAVPVGLGSLFGRFDGPHDGTVAVAETRLPGIADHVVVRASHSGLLLSAEAAGQAVHFLREGRFRGER
ncbi:esterase/lipase family protein [Vulcaniibacterium tengchongense]|uniref:Alpha/beta hydrolase family protein n=1 Tax=Vulcaniibacterium tengchongense TaxID=1273429 RepID=A0A3N4VA93_9GAMM|nr:alpha/beta hydrolase [Vulcaniibacterium tengchongense]RPE79478.1 hypothetical protein EDC50_1297 [Vulcaniibacterium tengchongense]